MFHWPLHHAHGHPPPTLPASPPFSDLPGPSSLKNVARGDMPNRSEDQADRTYESNTPILLYVLYLSPIRPASLLDEYLQREEEVGLHLR